MRTFYVVHEEVRPGEEGATESGWREIARYGSMQKAQLFCFAMERGDNRYEPGDERRYHAIETVSG